MISLILRVVAFILFVVVGLGWALGHHGGLPLVGFGLAAWVLSTLLGGYESERPWVRKTE